MNPEANNPDTVEETPTPEAPATDAPDGIDRETWADFDAAFDRGFGPFDIDEVDLEADDVKRIDLGRLVLTPFPRMTMQLQVDQQKEHVQAVLVGDGSSAMEVAVFAGPSRSAMLDEIREEIIAATRRANGQVEVVAGPFGAEMRRRLPVKDAAGNPAVHVSRTWLVSGPGWVLRGVVMGRAALEPDNEEAQLTVYEFFANLVVRRGTEPAAPGSLLKMTIPPVPTAPGGETKGSPQNEA